MKKTLFTVLAAFGILFAGCDREPGGKTDEPAGTGSIKLTIQSEAKAGGETRAIGPVTTAVENAVKNYVVYVFHSGTGAREAYAEVTDVDPDDPTDLTTTIDGLSTASAKRVVVLVNYATANLGTISRYSDLQAATILLTTQDPLNAASNGLFMSGEVDGVNLTTDPQNPTSIPVNVSRVVAKVILNNLTINAPSTDELGRFTLEGVAIQRVPGTISAIGTAMPATLTYYAGVAVLPDFNRLEMLDQAYELELDYVNNTTIQPDVYFYISPNDNINDMSTLLTIYGTYDSADTYYTFPINIAMAGDASGKGIERNWVYGFDVTLVNIGVGADGPNVINGEAALEVTVNAINWEGPLNSTVEW